MRSVVIGLLVVIVVAGCGRAPQTGPVGDFRIYEAASTRDAQMVQVIDSHAHLAQRQLPLGTPAPDWSQFYTVKSSVLEVIDPRSGIVNRSMHLAGGYQIPPATLSGVPGGISQNGAWLVLQAFDSAGNTVIGSHMLVVDTSFALKPTSIDLAGDFTFDAISNDGLSVYMIQHVGSAEYYVRLYHIESSKLDPAIVFDKSDGTNAMTGVRLSGVASPSGYMLFSVYARAHKGAFIHALMLNAPIAFCVDLPGGGYADGSDASLNWSLVMNAAGSTLYATNGAMGLIAQLNTGDGGLPTVLRTAHITSPGSAAGVVSGAQTKGFGDGGAVLSHDGRTLVMAGSTGVLWIDTATLSVRSSALAGWRIRSLAMSPDGGTVYAVSDVGAIGELSMAGAVKATFDPNVGQPMELMRVEAIS